MLICDLEVTFIRYCSTQLLATKECISFPSIPAAWWCYRTWELRLVSVQANDNEKDKHPDRRCPAKTSYKMPMWAQRQPVSCRVNSCRVVYTKRRGKKTDQRKYSKLDTYGQILSTLVYLHAVFRHTANWLHTIPSGRTAVLSVTLLHSERPEITDSNFLLRYYLAPALRPLILLSNAYEAFQWR